MKLDYGTQISPAPITLSVGTLVKPTLKRISEITFDRFGYYQILCKLTPKRYYVKLKKDAEYWNGLSDSEKRSMDIYDVIQGDSVLRDGYIDMLNFFFDENVVYKDAFVFMKNAGIVDNTPQLKITGVIASKQQFHELLGLIQQICCINEDTIAEEDLKFKNSIARKLFEKMNKAKDDEKDAAKVDVNLTLPNIISAVANRHQSLNYTNIWDLTLFQLLDSFNRMQTNEMYCIDARRVSVWGDEKKTFNHSLWYKNEYDKK